MIHTLLGFINYPRLQQNQLWELSCILKKWLVLFSSLLLLIYLSIFFMKVQWVPRLFVLPSCAIKRYRCAWIQTCSCPLIPCFFVSSLSVHIHAGRAKKKARRGVKLYSSCSPSGCWASSGTGTAVAVAGRSSSAATLEHVLTRQKYRLARVHFLATNYHAKLLELPRSRRCRNTRVTKSPFQLLGKLKRNHGSALLRAVFWTWHPPLASSRPGNGLERGTLLFPKWVQSVCCRVSQPSSQLPTRHARCRQRF